MIFEKLIKTYKKTSLVSALAMLLLIMILFLIVAKIYWRTSFFKETLTEELAFLLNKDKVELTYQEAQSKGLFGVVFKEANLLIDNERNLNTLEKIVLQPSISLFPLAYFVEFRIKAKGGNIVFVGKFKRPFSFRYLIRSNNTYDYYPGSWSMKFKNIPLALVSDFINAPSSLRANLDKLKGNLSGEVKLDRNPPFSAKSTFGNFDVVVNNLRIEKFKFNPVKLNVDLKNNRYIITKPFSIVRRQDVFLVSGEFDQKKSDFNIHINSLSHNSPVFKSLRNHFNCNNKIKTIIHLRGYKDIKCSG